MGAITTDLVIPVWDLDTGEVVEMEVSQDFLDADEAACVEREARRREASRREHELMRYDRD